MLYTASSTGDALAPGLRVRTRDLCHGARRGLVVRCRVFLKVLSVCVHQSREEAFEPFTPSRHDSVSPSRTFDASGDAKGLSQSTVSSSDVFAINLDPTVVSRLVRGSGSSGLFLASRLRSRARSAVRLIDRVQRLL